MQQDSVSLQPTADGYDTLYSSAYRQTYHSTRGALTEARHVFLEGSGARRRLEQGQPTRVLEVGFGAGLNFWLTVHYSQAGRAPLHYVALEKQLLPASLLASLNHGQLSAPVNALRQDFLAWRSALPLAAAQARWKPTEPGISNENKNSYWGELPPKPPGLRRSFQQSGGPNLQLTLLLSDARQIELPGPPYHAIYLDAFSPDANPELWTEEFLGRLLAVLAADGKLATYSAKGAVRRALQAVGFVVGKQPGPPGKKEMLVASR